MGVRGNMLREVPSISRGCRSFLGNLGLFYREEFSDNDKAE